MEFFKNPKYYAMIDDEKSNVKRFLDELKGILQSDRYLIFESLIKHLCYIQHPLNKDHPFIDNIIHGIEVARFCISKNPKISEVLLLAAIGHDWDRACGDKRIQASNYPNTKEGYNEYKECHAYNSAVLFCPELTSFFESEVIEKVRHFIINHEAGGEGELGILDFSDSMFLFTPDAANYYRCNRMYKSDNGGILTPKELELARIKGFDIKIKFMTETLNKKDRRIVDDYVILNLGKYDINVKVDFAKWLNGKL